LSRRNALLGMMMSLEGTSLACSSWSFASDVLPPLPKAYRENVHQIIKSVRESFDAESEGAKENEVRRKADPAKENVREFVAKWRDSDRVKWHDSHEEIVAAITELGKFYQTAGPRAKIPEDVKAKVRDHLHKAEAALEAAGGDGNKVLLGLFPGA